MDNTEVGNKREFNAHLLLLMSVFVVATCGLIYELVAGTAASYLLGDSVTQFSTIIGVYLFSMGIGSYLSKFFNNNLIAWFVQIEIMVGLVGGFSSTVLFMLFGFVTYFRVVLYSLVGLTGILVGLEIPLLMRILEKKYEFKELVSKVFTFDYIGALLASLIFPLVLVPHLGLLRTSFFFGILNVVVALMVCNRFAGEISWAGKLKAIGVAGLLALTLGFMYADELLSWSETTAYQENVIYAKSTPYQRVVLTQQKNDLRLYLNGNLQFSSMDEYRYHEALVHPAMHGVKLPSNVLVLGGGDGLAVRELLKYNRLKHITLVDLDKEITRLFTQNEILAELNQHAFASKKVEVINADAFIWLKQNKSKFDCIIVDFPDPSNYSVGKLYSQTFYKLLKQVLADDGVVVIQSTSPFIARSSFWCINNTLQSVGFTTMPYHTYVPSFGDWGFHIAFNGNTFSVPDSFNIETKFINASVFKQMLVFPPDMAQVKTEVNKLNNQVLVNYFENEWSKYQ